jgi:TonB-linked SusC/RagA family outer membrane protein
MQSSVDVDEVVVTALGIKRSEKTLGYSATTVKSDDLVKARNTNVAQSLSGKVAGVQIQSTSTDPGASSSIIIRGIGSINGSNQPLYVIDGVPLQNTTTTTQGHSISTGGISNVSANDIESMTVLKGASATALYGSRAANGVIIITTKEGSKGVNKNFTIQYNGGVQLRQVSLLPEFQNEFGQGWNGAQTYIENGSWGPRLDGSQQVYGPIWDGQQLIHEYSAVKDNVKDFFDIGVSQNHSVSISGISEDSKMNYYFSYSYAEDDGIMPSDADSYERNVLAYRGSYQANDWLKITTSVNFAKSETDIVGSYQGTSVIDGLYELPRDVSIVDKQDLSIAFNTPEAYFTPYGITNPYWAIANNYNHKDGKQIFGKVQLDINPIEELKLSYRFGFDYIDYDRKIGYPEIDLDDALIDEDYGYAPSNMNQDGWVYALYNRRYELSHEFLATYDKKFDDFSITAIAGSSVNERASTSIYTEVTGLSFDTGFWDLSNGSSVTDYGESQWERRLIGVFGDVTVGYKDMLFLQTSLRNDWSSTLPENANDFMYSGATLSWIFTELLPKNDVLSFGKLRLAYGKTGNDADPYQTSSTYTQAYANGYYDSDIVSFPFNGTNSFIAGGTAGSTDLEPEMTKEVEVGLNMQFFNGRIGIDAAYYNRITDNQIFDLDIDPAVGYDEATINFGEVENNGIELLLSTTPIKTSKFRWDLDINFSKNKNKVRSLPDGLEGKVSIYSFSAGDDAVYMYAEEGKAIGQYYTYLPQFVDDESSVYDGYRVVDEDGLPEVGSELESTGKDINHKWTGGISTAISAYGFTLSADLDVRYGGYMFSRTKNLMIFTGNGEITTYNDRNPFVVPNSVVETTSGYEENSSVIKMSDGSFQDYFDGGYGHGGEAYLIDRTFAKLRNITLAYTVPKKWVRATKLNEVKVSAFVNNAFIWTASDNYYVDPESTTTGSDLSGMFGELYSNPSARIYGFNVGLTF